MYSFKTKIRFLVVVAITCLHLDLYSYTFTWSGTTSTAWNTSSNWTRTGTGSGNTTPGSADGVVISNGSAAYQPVLNANLSITDFTLSAGSLNLNGFTLTVNNDGYFTGGLVRNGSLSVLDYRDMQNTTFTGPLTITKITGGGSNDVDGGNTFNGSITFINKDNSRFRLANANPDDFNGDVVFQQTSSGSLDPAYNYDNTFSGNISTVGTSTAIRFGRGSGVVVIDGNGSRNVLADAATLPTYDEIEVDFNGTFTLSASLIINENMTFTNGIVNTSSTDLLIFDNNATVSGASDASYVNGPVRKLGNNNSFDFPTGDDGIYAPISIISPSGGVSTNYFTAQYFKSANANAGSTMGTGIDHVSTNEYWQLDRSGSVQAYVSLSYNSSDRSGPIGDATVMRIAHWNGTNWANEGRWSSSSTSTASGTIRTSSRLSSFSPFTLGSASSLNALPVSLIGFTTSSYNTNAVTLDWKTSNERSVSHFTVERSPDGYGWTEVGRVEAGGNSQVVSHYSYTDKHTARGLVYYRLKMVDLDGSFSYSGVVAVNLSAPVITSVYPNPSRGMLNLEIGSDAGEVNIYLYDLNGKELASWIRRSGNTTIDISGFDNGVYQLEVEVDGASTRIRIIKQ